MGKSGNLSKKAFLAAGGGLLVFCQNLAAQDTKDQDTPSTIIIEGKRETAEKIAREQAKRLTRRPRASLPNERFGNVVCPQVVGMREDFARTILDRVRENLAKLRLSSGSPGCTPNFMIAFVNDASTEVEKLAEDDRWAFGDLLDYQIDRVRNERGASRAWHVSGLAGEGGQALGLAANGGGATQATGDAYGVPVNHSGAASRIRSSVSQTIRSSVVLIEYRALDHKSLGQIADFATLRGLAPVQELLADDPSDPDTILSLFSTPDAPSGLTEFDWAYLSGYYTEAYRLQTSERTLSYIAATYADGLPSDDRGRSSRRSERQPS